MITGKTVTSEELIEETVGKLVKSETDAKRVLLEETTFTTLVTSIAEKLPSEISEAYVDVAKYQRAQLIKESAVINNGQALAAAVAYFPVIAELMQKPVLYSLVVPWKVDSEEVRVPILKKFLKLIGANGTVLKTFELPLTEDPIESLKQTVTINNSSSVDLKTTLSLPAGKYKVILGETYLTTITVEYTDSNGNKQTQDILVTIPVQTRDPGANKGIINVNVPATVNGTKIRITGSVDIYDRELLIAASLTVMGSSDITVKSVTLKALVTSTDDSDQFRLKYDLKREEIRRYVELGIPHEAEMDIWKEVEYSTELNENYIRKLAEVIREQIQIIKDSEIARTLSVYENEYVLNGAVSTVDFANMPASIQPSNIVDFYRYIIPAIIKVSNVIYKNTQLTPQYLVASTEDAYILESLFEMVSLPGTNMSQMGISPDSVISMKRYQIIKSPFVPKGKVYLVANSGRNNPTLIDAVISSPIIRTETRTTTTKMVVIPHSKVVFIDPKKVGYIQLLNAPTF